MFFSTCFEIG